MCRTSGADLVRLDEPVIVQVDELSHPFDDGAEQPLVVSLRVPQAIGERPDELLPADAAIAITIEIGAQLLIYRPVQGQELGPLLVAGDLELIKKWVAVIDAATATEVALTTGLTAQLSATLSSSDVKKKLDSTRMLGPRIQLAKTLSMPLPARIQEDLVDYRNTVVHKGTDMTGAHAKTAIGAAWAVVRQYDPLPAWAHELGSPQGVRPISGQRRPRRGFHCGLPWRGMPLQG